jgi:hypothetical protein
MGAAYHLLTHRWPKNYLREDGYFHAHHDALDINVRTTLASSYPGTSHMRARSVSAGASINSLSVNGLLYQAGHWLLRAGTLAHQMHFPMRTAKAIQLNVIQV